LGSISFIRRTIYQASFLALVIVVWAYFVREQTTEMAMPPPWEVGRVFLNFIITGELLFKLYYTVLAILVGLVTSLLSLPL
jgi:ABC-type nitrate/sulfonate/bicarbonate transport system permease component